MRRPSVIEHLYLDFDGFFASVMQQAMPHLRGRPVGVIPFPIDTALIDTAKARTCVIACSREAKLAGCSNVMSVQEARAICPDIIFVPQRPDLYRRAHCALIAEIDCVIPVGEIKSIDELTCRLDDADVRDPAGLVERIKERLRREIGTYITCSVGLAANRLLAKIAGKQDKPNGCTVWRPEDMPGPLLRLPLDVVPGIGVRMEARLQAAGITTMAGLYAVPPKHLRKLWGSVTGERLWYALHGYEIHSEPTERAMYGHARVLPPDYRSPAYARECSRLLLVKAVRRMRRDGYAARYLHLSLDRRPESMGTGIDLPSVIDDRSVLDALNSLWQRLEPHLSPRDSIFRVGVSLGELVDADSRQRDIFLDNDKKRLRSEQLTEAIDGLNHKYGERVVTFGAWQPPPGGYAGGKISYTRIPSAEDFW